MCRFHERPYAGASDLSSLISFAQSVTKATLPAPSYYHPGDFAWQLYAFDSTDDVGIWRETAADRVVACAIFEPPLNFQFAVDPRADDQSELNDEVIAWAERCRAWAANKQEVPLAYEGLGNDALATIAFDTDAERIRTLVDHGYAKAQPAGVRFMRSLSVPLPDIDLPDGARFRAIAGADAEARAELHRDAWSVWGPSQHSVERYRRLRAAPLYDADLDIVLEHEGRFVSYCVCWVDVENRIGYFEPVGTRPSATGRGFGRAVIREGFRRLRERGMTVAIVGTATVNTAALRLYPSSGFEPIEREHFYVKRDRAG